MENFFSILFLQHTPTEKQQPGFFGDLNFVPVIDAITSGKEEYDLNAFFYTPLHDVNEINYRHEVIRDLEVTEVSDAIQSFARSMREMRKQLPRKEKNYYKRFRERLFLDAVKTYCDAVGSIAGSLSKASFKSEGLKGLFTYLQNYIQSTAFTTLFNETNELLESFSSVQYCVWTKDLNVKVKYYQSEADYTHEIEQVFDKFRQEAVKDYRMTTSFHLDMNDVEARILEGVAQLFPDLFQRLEDFVLAHEHFLDDTLARFDREVHFYLAYLDYIFVLKRQEVPFCFPEITEANKEVYAYNSYDLALAYKLNQENAKVVTNDFYLQGDERIIIVTGPNQGGKTTFARMFGQLHYLASLGLPVPGSRARLFLFDQIFTHFEKEENMINSRSKLEDDLIRIHQILSRATPRSIIIMNEILSSTTLNDAVFLSNEIMKAISKSDVLCVWVTFIDELLLLSSKTVSMVSMVAPDNPDKRTFKIERKPADGLAYARSIAEKYKLTYSLLKSRIKF